MTEDVDSLHNARESSAVRLLPGHDQWVMGPGTKDTQVTPPTHRQAMTRKANPLTVGGVVRGTWAARGEEVTVVWRGDRRPPRKAIEEEAGRLAGIIGSDLQLTLTVDV